MQTKSFFMAIISPSKRQSTESSHKSALSDGLQMIYSSLLN